MGNTIAIIPARGGSKRVPGKNIKKLNDKPLIVYSIEAAKGSKLIKRVIVSTDDRNIKKVSIKYGAEVIDRPKKIAGDKSPTIEAIEHVLHELKEQGYNADMIVLLQPTSPLRTAKYIDNAMKKYKKEGKDALVSVSQSNPFWDLTITKGKVKPLFGWKYFKTRFQDLPKTFQPNGAIFITTPENLRKNKGFYSENMSIYEIPETRSIDIDEEIDLKIAETILKNG